MTYKYRIYPTGSQVSRLENQFSMCRHLYNWNLEERITAYKDHGATVSYRQQQDALPGLKEERPWFKSVHSQVLQNVLRRLDQAYTDFFRRVKSGLEAPGFPRFKKPGSWDSITYTQYKDLTDKMTGLVKSIPMKDGKPFIKVSKIGDITIRYHRDIPKTAKIKILEIVKEAGRWFACFSFECSIANEPKQETIARTLGIDMGLHYFWYDSNGCHVPAPKHLRRSEKKLKRLQKRLARAKEQKDWPRFLRLKKALAKCHYRVKCRRNDFLHKTANDLLSGADLICFEDLKIRNMVRRPRAKRDESGKYLPNGAGAKAGLNKSMADAGWGKFLSIMRYKALMMGKEVVGVTPAYTSQRCSSCGEMVKKGLSVRTHKCKCGLVLNRDHNAAINILTLGLQGRGAAQEAPTVFV